MTGAAQGPIRIGGVTVPAGERRTVELRLTRLATHTDVVLPVHVVHGRQDGPRLFVSAAVHGDEINGVEIIRRVLERRALQQLRGTLLAVPIVNVHGFMAHARTLPDRRDLNRSFPGSRTGSLTSRLAHLFMQEVVARCTHGIDLHTGAHHRRNHPQIRADLGHPETLRLAKAFGVDVILSARLRDGSLRQAVRELATPVLVFEGGEALRFDPEVTRVGVRGVIQVMRALDMLPAKPGEPSPEPFLARSSEWVRAPESGVLLRQLPLGATVRKGDLLGEVGDPFGPQRTPVLAPAGGVLIGERLLPLVNEGDAIFHLARRAAREDGEEALLDGDLEPPAADEEAPAVTGPDSGDDLLTPSADGVC